jgi:hypothetical protein
MLLFKTLAISVMCLGVLGILLSAWLRVPEAKKDQRILMYIGAMLFAMVAVLIFFFGPN